MAKTKLSYSQRFQKPRDNLFHKSSKKDVIPSTSNEGSNDFFVRSSSNPQSNNQQVDGKKPFNKNKWRKQKYSLKNKVDKWKDKRTDYIRHGYYKEQKRETYVKFNVQKIYEEEEKREKGDMVVCENSNQDQVLQKQRNPKMRFKERIQKEKEEKERKREEFLKKKAEKEEAMKKYKKEKIERFKKLNKKTKKGQPVMKGKIEYLLEKIQKNMSAT